MWRFGIAIDRASLAPRSGANKCVIKPDGESLEVGVGLGLSKVEGE